MTSGHRLTDLQQERIGRLAAQRTADGNYQYSYRDIAAMLDISRDAVQDLARHCLINWTSHAAKAESLDELS